LFEKKSLKEVREIMTRSYNFEARERLHPYVTAPSSPKLL
jgi:hypothetical protein